MHAIAKGDFLNANQDTPYQMSARNTVSIVEATSWIINDKGQVILTASTPNVTCDRWWRTSPACPVSPH